MTVVHNFTVGISLLDPYCLLRVQYCFYQFSRFVADWVYGTMFPFIITSSVLLLLVQVLALMLCMSFSDNIFWNTILFSYMAHSEATVHGTGLSNTCILICVRFGITFVKFCAP